MQAVATASMRPRKVARMAFPLCRMTLSAARRDPPTAAGGVYSSYADPTRDIEDPLRRDGGGAARGLEQVVPARELDARAAELGAAGALDGVDRLPAGVDDGLGAAMAQEDERCVGRRRVSEPSRARVLQQQLDRLRRVLLVRTDHAARPTLDPASAVDAAQRLAVRAEDAAAAVRDRARALVEGDAGQR